MISDYFLVVYLLHCPVVKHFAVCLVNLLYISVITLHNRVMFGFGVNVSRLQEVEESLNKLGDDDNKILLLFQCYSIRLYRCNLLVNIGSYCSLYKHFYGDLIWVRYVPSHRIVAKFYICFEGKQFLRHWCPSLFYICSNRVHACSTLHILWWKRAIIITQFKRIFNVLWFLAPF